MRKENIDKIIGVTIAFTAAASAVSITYFAAKVFRYAAQHPGFDAEIATAGLCGMALCASVLAFTQNDDVRWFFRQFKPK